MCRVQAATVLLHHLCYWVPEPLMSSAQAVPVPLMSCAQAVPAPLTPLVLLLGATCSLSH